MAEAITIDVLLRAHNQTREGVKEASKALQEVEKSSNAAVNELDKVESSAKKAGQETAAAGKKAEEAKREVEDLGNASKNASKGLDAIEKSTKKARRGLDNVEKSSKLARRTLRELAREKVAILVEAKDRLTPVLERAGSGLKGLTRKAWSIPVKLLDYATRPIRGLLNMMTSLSGMVFGAAGAAGGVVAPMDISGDYEQTEMAFTTMLKSADKAKSFLQEASDFANKTPFEFPELIESSKLLLAFGFETEKVMGMMETIGDTSSGLGAGSEGIDRITRALGQMYAKGRVQSEELLQLQEMGVPANQILQEELGLTAKQVANIGHENIKAGKAIDALLSGMDKRYGGMMENQSKTAKGLMSTISDTFKNTFMRKWGTGLWEGFKPALEKITKWLDDNQDTVNEWSDNLQKLGASFSSNFMKHIESLQRRVREMIDSPEWENADFFSKAGIVWGEFIGEPLAEWWNGEGKQKVSEISGEIGDFIGIGLNRGIMALLGADGEGVLNDGMSAGASFADGFLKGFEPEKVKKVVLDAIKGIFDDSVFGGGNSSTTPFSTLLIGAVGLKGLGIGAQIGKGAYDVAATAKILSGLLKPAAGGTAAVAAGAAGSGSTTAGVAAAGGLSLPVLASLAGAILGAMGLSASVRDLKRAQTTGLTWERDKYTRRGMTKGGLVVGGAAAGAAIGSVLPGIGTLLGGFGGAALGGLTALFGGNSISEYFKTERERAHEALLQMGDDLESAVSDYNETFARSDTAQGLIDEYKELRDYMNSSDFDQTKAEEAQKRMKEITKDLEALFPGLIGKYEELNGLSSERIRMLEQEIEQEERRTTRELKLTVQRTKEQLPQMTTDYQEIGEEINQKQQEFTDIFGYRQELAMAYEAYQNAMSQEGLSEADEDKIYSNYLNDANYVARNHGLGENAFANGLQVQDELDHLVESSEAVNGAIDNLLSQQSELMAQVQKYYDASVQIIQSDTGVDLAKSADDLQLMQEAYDSIESNQGLTDDMRAMVEEILPGFSEAETATDKMDLLAQGMRGTRDEAQNALRKIQELNDTLDLLPDEKKIKITVGANGNLSIPAFSSQGVGGYACGGFVGSPELSWVGEDGLEAVIPLSGKYRHRGLELYEQAGRYLGIGRNAEGGVYAPEPAEAVTGGTTAGSSGAPLTLQITANPTTAIQINQGSSREEIMQALRQGLSGMTDQLLFDLAGKVLMVTENMPGGAG